MELRLHTARGASVRIRLERTATPQFVPITSLRMPTPADKRDLRRLRIEAGLTISDLAAQVHVPAPTLKRREYPRVRRLSDRASVDALVEALGVNADVVLGALDLLSAT